MRNDDMFIEGQFVWFTGVVEDVTDPIKLNRVRVRCFGFHSDNTTEVKTEDLPWATVIMPSTSPSMMGVGMNHQLLVGSWVVGFFRDGSSAQDPMVMGSIATQQSGVLDIPAEAVVNYPHNSVTKTVSGHLIEVDNTAGAERINIKHKTGTTINIDLAGTVTIDSFNTTVNIIGNTTITGTLHVTEAVTGAAEITAKAGSQATDAAGNPITNEDGSAASGSVTLTGHTHVEIPGTGGASSPTPSTAETKSPTKGT
jgi:hypothetical protein